MCDHISMDLKDTKGKVPLRDYTKLSSSSKSSDKKKTTMITNMQKYTQNAYNVIQL